MLPGDPVKLITGERAIEPALYDQIVKENALDKPLWYQYGRWMGNLFQGDLGRSYQVDRPVTERSRRLIPQHHQAWWWWQC